MRYLSAGSSLFLFLCALISTACSGMPRIPLLCEGRRPQVIVSKSTCVLDYDPVSEEECGPIFDNISKYAYVPDPDEEVFRFSAGDVVEVDIFGEEEVFADNDVVAPDGKLYFAFVDGVQAQGRTVPEVTDELSDKLKRIFVDPIVTLLPRTSINNTFKIFGRVQRPGVYLITEGMRLREAIGQADGLMSESYTTSDRSNSFRNSNAEILPIVDLEKSFIQRKGEKLPVNFHDLILSANSMPDILIEAGDYIYIAPKGIQDIFVLGNIRYPQKIRLTPGMALIEALGYANGWINGTPFGPNLHKVVILRGPLENPLAFEVDVVNILQGYAYDVKLQKGDIIYVTNKTMRFGRELVKLAVDSFVQAFSVAPASYYGQFQWFTTPGQTTSTSGN